MKTKKYSEELFLAVELPRFARERIVEARKTWRKQLKEDVRWLPPQSFFLPLRSLGELHIMKSKHLSKKLEKLCAALPLIQLVVDGIEASPNRQEARFFFLKMEDSEALAALRRSVDACCDEAKIERDRESPASRIALSKRSDPQAAPALEIKRYLKGFKAKGLSLVEMRSGPKGPTYRTLRKYPFSVES